MKKFNLKVNFLVNEAAIESAIREIIHEEDLEPGDKITMTKKDVLVKLKEGFERMGWDTVNADDGSYEYQYAMAKKIRRKLFK